MRAESRRIADGDLYRLGKISGVTKPGGGSSTAKQISIDKSEEANGNPNQNLTKTRAPNAHTPHPPPSILGLTHLRGNVPLENNNNMNNDVKTMPKGSQKS